MTDGERFLRRQAVEQAYDRGFADGIAAAKEEDDRRFREREPVYLGSKLINAPTAAERKAERMKIIKEAHDAGIHTPKFGRKGVLGCPDCEAHYGDRQSQLPHNGDYGVTAESWCECDWLGAGTPRHAPSPMCRSLRPDAPRSQRYECGGCSFATADIGRMTGHCVGTGHIQKPSRRPAPVPSPGKCGNGWLESQGTAVADESHVHLCLTLRAQPHVCTCSRCPGAA